MAGTKGTKIAVAQGPRGRRNEVVGVVVSDKMNKTISVNVERLVKHSKYEKYLRTSSIYKAHDEKGEAKVGDQVRIASTRPLSKTKRWKLVEIVKRADQTAEALV